MGAVGHKSTTRNHLLGAEDDRDRHYLCFWVLGLKNKHYVGQAGAKLDQTSLELAGLEES